MGKAKSKLLSRMLSLRAGDFFSGRSKLESRDEMSGLLRDIGPNFAHDHSTGPLYQIRCGKFGAWRTGSDGQRTSWGRKPACWRWASRF